MKISIKMLPPRSTFVENECTTQQKLDTAQIGPFQAKWLDINIFIFTLYLSAVFFFLLSRLSHLTSACLQRGASQRKRPSRLTRPSIFYSAAAQPRAPPDGPCLQARPRASMPNKGPCCDTAPHPSVPFLPSPSTTSTLMQRNVSSRDTNASATFACVLTTCDSLIDDDKMLI